jgi:uncharacterized protein YecE (DUF72 family)
MRILSDTSQIRCAVRSDASVRATPASHWREIELQVWADRIMQSGARRVWIYFTNDNDCYAISNARALQRLLKSRY